MNAKRSGHRTSRFARFALTVLTLLVLSACLPDADDVVGTPPDLSGVWSGAINELSPPATSGTLTLTASHEETTIFGSFTATFPGPIVNSGDFDGTLNENRTAGIFHMTPSDQSFFCPLTVVVALDGRRIVGNFAANPAGSPCSDTDSNGTVDISKN